jgi:uncharacterized membrane protein YgcG
MIAYYDQVRSCLPGRAHKEALMSAENLIFIIILIAILSSCFASARRGRAGCFRGFSGDAETHADFGSGEQQSSHHQHHGHSGGGWHGGHHGGGGDFGGGHHG